MRQSHIAILGAPLDLGQSRAAWTWGLGYRVANLNQRVASLGYQVDDLGSHVGSARRCPKVRRCALLRRSRTCPALGVAVTKALGQGKVPIVFSGDHSVAIGTVSGVSRCFRKRKKQIGLIWIDRACRHEYNRNSSPSRQRPRMPLPAAWHRPEGVDRPVSGTRRKLRRRTWRWWACAKVDQLKRRTCAFRSARVHHAPHR